MHKLKPGQEAFEVVDGPMAGQAFKPGHQYKTIPESEKNRFKEIKISSPAQTPAKAKPASKSKKTEKE